MDTITHKLYTPILQVSIVALTFALVWFAFIYYPKVINGYKTGNIQRHSIVKPISANSSTKFPIETSAYRIVYEEGSQTYYTFVEGVNLDQFVVNKNNAELAIKTAQSLEKLCNLNIVYASAKNLKIPQQFQGSSNCK